jgi:acetyltransferase
MFNLCETWPINDSFIPQSPGNLLRQSRKGRAFNLRPLEQIDTPLLANFLSSLSSTTLWLRFFAPYPSLSGAAIDREILRLNQINQSNGSVLVATRYAEGKEEIIGIGELIPDQELNTTAELAITIRDDYQGEGLGSALANQLVHKAANKGMTTLQAETMAQNRPMIRIWTKLGFPYSFQTRQSFTTMLAHLDRQ